MALPKLFHAAQEAMKRSTPEDYQAALRGRRGGYMGELPDERHIPPPEPDESRRPSLPHVARVAAGEPRGARESVTPQGVAGSTPAPGPTCTESLCEHGIGAVGELW